MWKLQRVWYYLSISDTGDTFYWFQLQFIFLILTGSPSNSHLWLHWYCYYSLQQHLEVGPEAQVDSVGSVSRDQCGLILLSL